MLRWSVLLPCLLLAAPLLAQGPPPRNDPVRPHLDALLDVLNTGDSAKARAQLGWTPSVDFAGLVQMMVDADLERVATAPRALDRLSTL